MEKRKQSEVARVLEDQIANKAAQKKVHPPLHYLLCDSMRRRQVTWDHHVLVCWLVCQHIASSCIAMIFEVSFRGLPSEFMSLCLPACLCVPG